MAIAVIGGVVVSTLLTLYAVPCAYLTLNLLERKETTSSLFREGANWVYFFFYKLANRRGGKN